MSEPTPEQDRLLNRLRVPAAVLLALLLMVGAYYTLHYRTNADYLASRNFRLLATLGNQVREAVRNEGILISNTVESRYGALSPRIEDIGSCTVPWRLPDQTTRGGALKLWRTLDSSDGTYRISFKSERAEENTPSACGRVELNDLLDPLFSSRKAFDAVLLANSTGKVVYLHGPKSLRVEQLDLLIQNRHDSKVATSQGQEKDNDFNAFQGYSGSAEAELGDRLYTTFVQPFSLQLASVDTAGTNETPHEVWLLAGLVAKDELITQSLALSPSSVAFLLGILLLAALAWPLAKLKMLGERQRVKRTDVLLVGVCSLLGVSVVTMFLLDFGVYRTLKSSAEMQLKDFAEQMESNLLVEIRLAYDQMLDFERLKSAELSQRAKTSPFKASYPHFESFALISDDGQQVFKQTKESIAPLISVAERMYFQRIQQGMTLNIPEPEEKSEEDLKEAEARPKGEPFFLESVRSWTNGKWQAVIASPVSAPSEPPAQVAALAIQMVSVIDPVLPPGFEFAVVGDDGTVLFHSDSARNLAEDFFEETDQDRRFHSIVLARHDEAFDVHYWGERYRAFAIPVKGLPWTIVAMRNEQVLEKVNLDWLVTTLILVLVYLGTFTLALTVATFLRPGFQAVWIWPDRDRSDDYVKLVAIFVTFCIAFLIALFGLRGTGFLFGVAGLLPALSFVAAYLILNQAGNRTARKRAVEVCGVLLLTLLGFVLSTAPLEQGAGLWVRWSVLALAVCAFLLAADGPRRWRELQPGARMAVSRSYPVLGLLLVFLAAVLPTAGFFKIAHRLQMNSFVRNGQLNMAKELHDRFAPLTTGAGSAAVSGLTVARGLVDEHPVTLARRSKPSLNFYGSAFFDTTLSRPGRCKGEQEEAEPLAVLLPPYSDYTAQSREMLHSHTSDDDWEWCESEEGDTLFDGESYLGVSLASNVEPAWRGNGPLLAIAGLLRPPEETDLVMETQRSPLAPGPKRLGSMGKGQVLRGLLALGVLSLFSILLYTLVIFVARRIFLLDLQEPRWAGRTGDLPAMVGANVLLISRTKSWRIHDRKSFFPLSFRDLDKGEKGWPARRLELLRSPDLNVLVEDFEHRAFDPVWSSRKLALLEELIFVHQRTVVVLSELSPTILFSPAGVPADPAEDRWRTLLASFTQINEDVWPPSEKRGAAGSHLSFWHEIWDVLHGRPGKKSGPDKPDDDFSSELLRQECGKDLFLKKIGRELEALKPPISGEQVLEELGERAQGYYGTIWASCSRDERVVLGHLAEEGLVNAKNRRIVRRLMVRGLIQRAPNLRLMTETFRRFVVSPICREQVLSLEQAAGRSAWDRFLWPFSATLAACAALILVTQQELLDSTIAAVTGVTAGLPTLLKIFDLMGWKKGVKSA